MNILKKYSRHQLLCKVRLAGIQKYNLNKRSEICQLMVQALEARFTT